MLKEEEEITMKTKMYDFVLGKCAVMEDKSRFLDLWLETKGNPCLVCGVDKSNCSFYIELSEKGVLGKEKSIERRRSRDRDP